MKIDTVPDKHNGLKRGDKVVLKHTNSRYQINPTLVVSRLGRLDYGDAQVEVAYWMRDEEGGPRQLVTKWIGAEALVKL